jgi:hypothetical protein
MFPEMDGVKGESKDKTNAKQIDLLSWSWGMSNKALALGLVVLVSLGGYAWRRANCHPLPATEAQFRLTAAPRASSSAPLAAASATPEWDTGSPMAISDPQTGLSEFRKSIEEIPTAPSPEAANNLPGSLKKGYLLGQQRALDEEKRFLESLERRAEEFSPTGFHPQAV